MWFLEKVRASPGEAGLLGPFFPALGQAPPEKGQPGAPAAAAFSNILTPDRIPEFCIPPRLSGPPLPKSPSPAFQPRRCLTEPGLQQAASPGAAAPHLIQVESVEEPPEEAGSGDAEPGSRAALSLPHVPRARTSYGFCRLLESPHTRRKESIFHGEAPAPPLPPPRARASSCGGGRPAPSSPIAIRRPFRWDSSDTASSSGESSPYGSPLLARSAARPGSLLGKARSQEGLLGKALRARRLSGLPRTGSLSTEESSSTDSSPSAPRRASESLPERPCRLSPPALFPLDLPRGGRERLGQESTVALARGALLRLASEYCAESRRLRIRLISAEGLYQGAALEPQSINCCVAFSLLPGKLQKQRSTVIRRSRNPIFNEDFFFLGIAEEHLGGLAVRMKATNKAGNMKRDLLLGESHVPLRLILAG